MIEVLTPYNCLGIVLSNRGSFIQATNILASKGLRVMGSLLYVTKQLYVPIATMFNLFDAYVTSILNYGCELCSFMKYESIKRVHRNIC